MRGSCLTSDRVVAWLIEAPGHHYLHVKTLGHVRRFAWTKDHDGALRFRSKREADDVMTAVRDLVPALFGFAEPLGEAWPVEHAWVDGSLIAKADPA